VTAISGEGFVILKGWRVFCGEVRPMLTGWGVVLDEVGAVSHEVRLFLTDVLPFWH